MVSIWGSRTVILAWALLVITCVTPGNLLIYKIGWSCSLSRDSMRIKQGQAQSGYSIHGIRPPKGSGDMEAALSDFHSGRSIAIILKWVVPGRGDRKDSDQELAAAASVSTPRSSAPPGGAHKMWHLLSILKRDYRAGVSSNGC